MKTNRLLLAALLASPLLASTSCTQSPEISGHVEGRSFGKKVYLMAEREETQPLDSAEILSGDFRFGMEGRPEGIYELKTESGRNFEVYYGGDAVKLLLADGGEAHSCVVAGAYTPIINAHYALNEMLLASLDSARKAVVEARLLNDPSVSPELERRANRCYSLAGKRHRRALLELAHAYPDCPMSLYLYRTLLHGIQDEEILFIDSALNTWSKHFDGDANMLTLRSYIAAEQAVAVGKPFVDFTVLDHEGHPVRLSAVAGRGKPVLVYFWTSVSPYCRRANKKLLRLYREFHGRGLEVFQVSFDTNRAAWLGATKEDQLPWRQYQVDPNARTPVDIYRVATLPYSILITPKGHIMVRGSSAVQLELLLNNMLS